MNKKNEICLASNYYKLITYYFFFIPMLSIFFSCLSDRKLNQNNLKTETSAYLIQHAENPVYWQRWDEDLYKKLNSDKKLLIVSIGYSSCHWCHVMEEETFEDNEVADYMNTNFVAIKVDREENPEIDNIYMTATQMITGSGGWPLNVVCLPDGRPVYGGTYHSKKQWLEVLGKIQQLYENNNTKLYAIAEKIEKGIQEVNSFSYTEDPPAFENKILEKEMEIWSKSWDKINGGEVQNQKFIIPVKFNYILQFQKLNKDEKISDYFEKSLLNISLSGIVDHLEGGFYRYTVDPEWKIPHFEKMLYDNAQLLTLYSNAYKEYKNPQFKSTVNKTFSFLQNRMRNSEGGYFSAIDADNKDGEGRYYTFNKDEILKVGSEDLELFLEVYQIDLDDPSLDFQYHLRNVSYTEGIMSRFRINELELNKKKLDWERRFKIIQNEREFPMIDKKIITSWNGQIISGLIDAFEAFKDDKFLVQAKETFEFIDKNLFNKSGLMHTYQANSAKIEANLEDYAFTITAALDLYENTGNTYYLEKADKITKIAIKKFETNENPFFTFTENPVLFSKIISLDDNVIASANSKMAENLWELGHIYENEGYTKRAKNMLDAIIKFFAEGRGKDYSQWAQLLAKELFPFKEVIIVGPEARKVSTKIKENYFPNVLFQISEKESKLPLLEDRFLKDETLIYVCENKVCLRPSKSVSKALQQIIN
tara:strand:- start:18105 stop:20225 length:2121 start_codon:yes stop_codon:yes gene_type:complete